MKGKLHKMVSGYILSLNGDIDDPYAIVNEELAEDYGWRRLSLKNCQAIERGYDLDGLAKKEYLDGYATTEMCRAAFKDGFQKALELMGDKKFSINEVAELTKILISNPFETCGKTYQELTDSYIQSLQQTQWDVEIRMEEIHFGGGCYKKQPKLDATGCLILKRI